MRHSRRQFIKTGSAALGSFAVSTPSVGGLPPQAPPGAVPPMDPPEGNISVQPDEGIAGMCGTWTVTYRVGKSGIKKHGGIRVQLPDSWHSGIRNSANRLHSSDPESDNYISSSCSQPGIELRTWVEHEPGREVVLV